MKNAGIRTSTLACTNLKYSDRHLAGLFARPPDRVELIGAGSLGYGTGPGFG